VQLRRVAMSFGGPAAIAGVPDQELVARRARQGVSPSKAPARRSIPANPYVRAACRARSIAGPTRSSSRPTFGARSRSTSAQSSSVGVFCSEARSCGGQHVVFGVGMLAFRNYCGMLNFVEGKRRPIPWCQYLPPGANPFGALARTSARPGKDEGAHDMERTARQRESTWRTSVGRIAAVAVAIGWLSAFVFAPGTAVAATSPATASAISTAKNAKLGTILVAGNTVYALKASKTTCDAACLKVWPPVLLPDGVTTATADAGVDASKLGTMAAAGGALQVTYAGKALYWFSKDKAPGQVRGNLTDKWGKWFTVATVKSSSGSGGSNAGTGGTSF
jgi:predicted lipoprotein with Yx(FWY)xxD motif